MEGRLPRGFCVKCLTDLPMLWSEQWRALGLQQPEGFTPTPEMLEIAEAQALLAALERETPLPSGEGQG